ncbi:MULTISPECIES: TonB-dependent receptor [unclassified Lysobacter]
MRSTSSRLAISIAAAMVAISLSAPLHAQDQVHEFNVQQQDASSGIREFAQQAGIQVIVSGDDAQNRIVNGVSGTLPPRAALDRLIAGTGLTVRSFDNNVAVLGPEPPATPSATEASGEDISTLSNVVVTGSRIARPELESSMPIGVIDMDRAMSQGKTTLYETVLQDVAVGPGNGPYNSSPEGQYDGGIATIELRNMGVARSLTLVDGRRRVSSGQSSSAVDINMIPAAMVERIEIITGGAAAVYGADAVTGAANIITRKDFEGLEFSATTGTTQDGGGDKTQFSVVAGTSFADGRGSMMFGGTWAKNDPIHYYDRYSKGTNLSYQVNPENTGPNDGIADRIIRYNTTNMYLQPAPTIYAGGDTYLLNPDGSAYVGAYDTCHSGCGTSRDGGDGGMPQSQHWSDFLIAPIENASLMGRFDYQLTDRLNFGMNFDYGRSKYDSYRRPYRDDDRLTWLNGAGGAVAYLDNPFLPDSFRDVMLANGLESTVVQRSYENFGQMTDHSDRQTFNIGSSLDGEIAAGFQWEAFWQHGRSTNDIHANNVPMASRLLTARDVIADENGIPVCRDEAARALGCVPLDVFSTEELSPELRDWMMATRRKHREQRQTIFGGSLAGELFSLPAGEVQAVLGIEHRKESIHNVDDNGAAAPANELSHLGTWAPYEPELAASNDVSEIYAELVVPVLKDLPFAHRLTVEGAYRYSDYSDFDSTNTWKLGTSWAPIESLTLRATKSRSVRVPNFGELYSARAVQEIGVRDACLETSYQANPTRMANCAALMQQLGVDTPYLPSEIGTGHVITGGSQDVTPEISDSVSAGLVWQPQFVRGLDLTLDYWNIKLDNMITAISRQNILNLCMDLPSSDNEFCDRITRDSRGYAEGVDTSYMNVSESEAKGIDLGANYRFDLGPGRLSLGLRASYLLKYETTTLPGVDTSRIIYDGGYQNPDLRGNLSMNYDIGDWEIGLNNRYWGKALNYTNVSVEAYDGNRLPARLYNDLTVGWHINEHATFRVGVNNLFDAQSPYRPRTYEGGGGVYDVYGRYFYVNAKLSF